MSDPKVSTARTTGSPATSVPLRAITLTLAFACGASVANLYYAQPLLELIARSFHVGQGTASIVVTATQLGYALGLGLLLPLGDLVENRALASRTLVLTATALAVAALAPDFGLFLVVSVLVGTTSVVAQILVPFAAHLAPPAQRGKIVGAGSVAAQILVPMAASLASVERRGQVVGTVMSGLLLGILLARTLASLAAAAWGWRSIYFISAGLMLLTAFAVVRLLPKRTPPRTSSYGALLSSLGELIRNEPVLRRRAVRQACMFGSFSAFWTAITYELVDAHHLSQTGIAIFALVGAGGAGAAPIAGRLGDRGVGHFASGAAILLAAAAMVLAGAGAGSVVLLAAAGVLLDVAVQTHQVLSQREIYALREDARARVNAVYMGTVFIGGAISSAIAGVLHSHYGWTGVTIFAAALPLVAAGTWLRGSLVERVKYRGDAPAPSAA
jgi:predicted MFS family arabinose efflux permease